MKKQAHIITSVIVSGLFLLLDQVFKYIAYNNPDTTAYIIKPWIGWEYFENPGIAFGIPIPQPIILLLSPIIIIILVYWLGRGKQKTTLQYYGIVFIIAGALSNFIDRMLFAITIDYIRIITSLINIGDVLVVVGAGLLLLEEFKKGKR